MTARPRQKASRGGRALLFTGLLTLLCGEMVRAETGIDAAPDAADAAPDAGPDAVVDAAPDAEPDSVPPFVPTVTKNARTPLRWTDSNCISLLPNSAGSDNIDDGSDLQAIRLAVEQWQQVIADCSYLRIDVETPSPDAKPHFEKGGSNESVVYWVESDWTPTRSRQAAAITTVSFVDSEGDPNDGKILDADIELNGQIFAFATTGARRRTDIQNTLVHELGHLMGLDHVCDDGQRVPAPLDNEGNALPSCFPASRLPATVTEATMYNFAGTGETKKRTPDVSDINGICSTYPIAEDPEVCAPSVLTSRGGCQTCSQAQGLSDEETGKGGLMISALIVLLALLLQRRLRPRARPSA